MIWKLYKAVVIHILECAVIVSSHQDTFYRLDEQINKINRLTRIIEHIRQFHNLHPNHIKDTYGTLEEYLRQHISDSDWGFLTQLQLIESRPSSAQNQQFFKIA